MAILVNIPVAGAELPFHLTLPFQGFDVSFDIKAEVVRTNAAEKMFAVRYTEIGERERELMQHFIEELVRGSMSDVEDTIQRIDVPVTPARLEPDTKKIPGAMPVRRWPVKTVVMTTFYALAGNPRFSATQVCLAIPTSTAWKFRRADEETERRGWQT